MANFNETFRTHRFPDGGAALRFTPAEWRSVLEDRGFLASGDNRFEAPRKLMCVPALIYTHMSEDTLGDEIAWFGMAFFLGTIVLSFMTLRRVTGSWQAVWIDRLLFIGLAVLTVSMVVVGTDLH